MSALLAALAFALQLGPPCFTATTLGYLRVPGALTADGTPITTAEPIVAAHPRFRIGTMLSVEGFSRNPYRVADRGLLEPEMLDFPVWSLEQAYALTGQSRACVVGP